MPAGCRWLSGLGENKATNVALFGTVVQSVCTSLNWTDAMFMSAISLCGLLETVIWVMTI